MESTATDATTEADFSKFDTPGHRAAQRACACAVHHAIDAQTRRGVWQNLQNARASADPIGLMVALVQLTGHCPHRPVTA
jgi:hypothetical protein